MNQPNYKAIHREDDKQNLETVILQVIKDINYLKLKNQMTPEKEQLKESLIRSYNVFINAENIGYDFLYKGDD